jgi:hypothetical protein
MLVSPWALGAGAEDSSPATAKQNNGPNRRIDLGNNDLLRISRKLDDWPALLQVLLNISSRLISAQRL